MNLRGASAALALGLVAVGGALVAACGNDREPGGSWDVAVGPGEFISEALPGEATAPRITVAAASDLREAFTALEPRIERACATDVVMVYGSSGQLRTQVVSGADFALFLSADTGYASEVFAAGRAAPNGLASYGAGRLALAWRDGLAPLEGVGDLSRTDIKTVAIANPDHAPYGRAARQALERAGVYAAVKGRIVTGENIRQATDYVEQGNADAGLVALALVKGTAMPYLVVDASLHDPIVQTGVVVKGTGAEATGRCVLRYLLDPEGQELLRQYGFEKVQP